MRALRPLALVVPLLLPAATARAGAGGYFTTYNSEVDSGEVELMLMNDFTLPSRVRRDRDGQQSYGSHMLELEYGVTQKLVTELMLEWFEEAGRSEFTGVRVEARYRLFEDPVPLNPMLYAEYEDLDPNTRYKMEVSGWVRPPYAAHESAGRERILETRLVLADQVGPLEVALNWINETDLREGTTGFGYAAGVMWMHHRGHGDEGPLHPHAPGATHVCPMHPDVQRSGPGACPRCGMELVDVAAEAAASGACACARSMHGCGCSHCGGRGGKCTCAHAGGFGLGLEVFGGLGDSRSFGLSAARQEHYLGPIAMMHLTPRWMIHGQVAIGLTEVSDQLFRFNIGYEF